MLDWMIGTRFPLQIIFQKSDNSIVNNLHGCVLIQSCSLNLAPLEPFHTPINNTYAIYFDDDAVF